MSFIKKFNDRLPEKWDLTTKWTWAVITAWILPFIFSTALVIIADVSFTGTMLLTGIFVYFMATAGLGFLFTILIAIFRTTFD